MSVREYIVVSPVCRSTRLSPIPSQTRRTDEGGKHVSYRFISRRGGYWLVAGQTELV
jgi:hypothetical protein